MAQVIHTNHHQHFGQDGRLVVRGYGSFTTTGTTVDLLLPLDRVDHFNAFPIGTPAVGESFSIAETVSATYGSIAAPSGKLYTVSRSGAAYRWLVPFGSLASNTNGTLNAIAPVSGVISAASVVSGSADAADSDTDLRSFGILNKTQTLAPVAIATAANTTALTGGTAMVAYTPMTLTLAAAAQLLVTAGDVFEFTVSDTGTGVALNGIAFEVQITPTSVSGREFFFEAIGSGT
jgi:hypothetical protein